MDSLFGGLDMPILAAPFIAAIVYIASFKDDFEKKDLDTVVPVFVVIIVLCLLLGIL